MKREKTPTGDAKNAAHEELTLLNRNHKEYPDAPEKAKLEAFIEKMRNENDIVRTAEDAPKLGMFTGSYAIHPLTGERVPIWIANYVLYEYGTGAVMAVPTHDQRDGVGVRAAGGVGGRVHSCAAGPIASR